MQKKNLADVGEFTEISTTLATAPKNSRKTVPPELHTLGELRVTEFGRHNGILMVKQYQWYMNGILMGYDIVND